MLFIIYNSLAQGQVTLIPECWYSADFPSYLVSDESHLISGREKLIRLNGKPAGYRHFRIRVAYAIDILLVFFFFSGRKQSSDSFVPQPAMRRWPADFKAGQHTSFEGAALGLWAFVRSPLKPLLKPRECAQYIYTLSPRVCLGNWRE